MDRFIVRDRFTSRIVKIYNDLVKRGAVTKRKYFTDTILMYDSSRFYKVENSERNFPEDVGHRENAIRNLKAEYNVNPDYLRGSSEKMYLSDPPLQIVKQKGDKESDVSLYAIPQRKALLAENKLLRERIAELEKEVQSLRRNKEMTDES